MRIVVSAPGAELEAGDQQGIERDLQKIARRLGGREDALAEVRINHGSGAHQWHVVLEVHYGPNHLMAKEDHADVGQAVREAREEILRQINDRSRGGHSSIAKRS